MALVLLLLLAVFVPGCSRHAGVREDGFIVVAIDAPPIGLDPRIGTSAYSERLFALMFSSLMKRDDHGGTEPDLAESVENPDPLTYIFHLRSGVRFHDGRPLTSRDVKWSFDSLLSGKIRSTRAGAYRFVDHIDAPDDTTVIFHLKEPYTPLLWNLSTGAVGIVPYGSGSEITTHPMGSGPFKFV